MGFRDVAVLDILRYVRHVLRLAVVIACAGCGRIAFDPLGGAATDATGDGSSPCTAFGAFSPPVKLDAVLQSNDDDWFPSPAVGETQLFFYSFRAPSSGADIWTATRSSRDVPFSAPQIEMELASANDEIQPSITEDGLVIAFSIRTGAAQADLYIATRSSPTAAWGMPVEATAVNDPASVDFNSYVTGDGLRLWFASGRLGGVGGTDLYESVRTSRADPFPAPRLVVELSSPSSELSPTTSADGLDVFFASNRSGGPGLFDVYTAHRPALDQMFSTPRLVPELSSTRDEDGLRLTPDGTTMYLNYDTLVNGGGNAEMWISTRTCLD